ncbi:hypothetical protein FH972_021394 [Carpinus fangiana]|uniref:Uncharacterized protein n=1 Tax=Carpinus fangiana TaxID=176857 RepID=A0A5N6KPV3_9ROSI|nr:hypothetical protein FH972_021394 [Carpinus fangiana]
MKAFNAGMQVHAVPDDERALDNRGQPLPWGYAYGDAALNRKAPLEKGPFGRTTNRRSVSRRTATPTTKDDLVRLENQRNIDDIFGRFKAEQEELQQTPNRGLETAAPPRPATLTHSRSAFDVTSGASISAAGPAAVAAAAPQRTPSTFKEPTEVLIYGYGVDHQYSALSFFEQASQGNIYEDYDREPSQPRFASALSVVHSVIPRSLPQEAIRKINTYRGGDHWIKVTFDSPGAAELACHASPHTINGYSVFAEPWRGTGPNQDVAIAAGSQAPLTLTQRRTPAARRQGNREFNSMPGRSQTMPNLLQQPLLEEPSPVPESAERSLSGSTSTAGRSSSATATGVDIQNGGAILPTKQQKPLRISTAKRAVLLDASQALLPVQPWSQRTFGGIPLLGLLFGGTTSGTVIGSQVPRTDTGEFDWAVATLWWRFWFWIDSWLGTDICGLKGED